MNSFFVFIFGLAEAKKLNVLMSNFLLCMRQKKLLKFGQALIFWNKCRFLSFSFCECGLLLYLCAVG